MTSIFIKRPVLSLVISIFILLLGILSLTRLPVTQFPDIVPPSVTVTAKYTGANAEVSANAVALPIERAINGVPGMTYMSTVTSNDGLTVIQVFFQVGTDPDQAAVNVQNRVNTILDELPEEVIRAGVTTEKEVNSMLMYLNLTSTDPKADEAFIYNFADINVVQELKRIDGVGRAEIMGQQEYAMRIWLNPEKMVAYNVSAEEIVQALRKQNVEAAPGKVGENSGTRLSSDKQYVLKYTGKFYEPSQYKNLIIRSTPQGDLLRLRDIATVDLGAATYSMESKTDGRPSASIMIKQRPGSNASEVIDNIKKRMGELKETDFPPGMEYSLAYDVSSFLDASIHEVIRTLIEAFILVFIVVFLFLQDFKSTLIPAIAVPVALIGTFTFMGLLGFSVNLLTLFALVLAIGIVVDDAIVVVEAVHVKMEQGLSPLDASMAAMKEISGPIVSITLVMSAVFIPVAFLSGPVGVFYRQFSLTLAFAILISGINALTLSPALCALLLKREGAHQKPKLLGGFFSAFNRVYHKTEVGYGHLLSRLSRRKGLTVMALVLFLGLTWGFAAWVPKGFMPTEDQGMVYVNVTTPPGATLERTRQVMDQVQQRLGKEGTIESISTLAGYSLINEVAGATYGMGMINLKKWDERSERVPELIKRFETLTRDIADAQIEFFPPPAVPGFGNASGFELRLLDRTGSGDLQYTAENTRKFMDAVARRPEVKNIFTSFSADFPQYLIEMDYAQAAQKGVSVENAMSNLQTLIGSFYATNFIRFNQMYKVIVQLPPEAREAPENVLGLYVKNDSSQMVPYSQFTNLEKVFGTDLLTRYNMYNAAMLNGEPADGYSSGEAIKAIEEVAAKELPRGYGFEWSGMTREEILSGNQTLFIFAICFLFVYLLLSAQYESFILPLAVMLSLPTGIFGAYLGLKIAGLDNNIYAQVALVMLIGLLSKNAILIVEMAEQHRKAGSPVLKAVLQGAKSRLRPILMTSFAFNAGLIPLCIANGAGALGNRSIGTSAASGMLIGTLFGLVLIPGLYVLFASLIKRKTDIPEIKNITNENQR